MTDLSQFTLEQAKTNEFILIEVLAGAGANFKGNACTCPFHEDEHASAGIYRNEVQQWCFKCQTCGVQGSIIDIIARIENVPADDVLKRLKSNSGSARRSTPAKQLTPKVFENLEALKASMPGVPEDPYIYTNPDTGEVDLIICRCQTPEGKTFRQCSPVEGGFIQKKPDGKQPLYNRKRVQLSNTVVVVEGEKCVHALQAQGVTATTSPAGAGKAEHADWSYLAGKSVILWPDNDVVGRNHMAQVEAILLTLEPSPRIAIIEPNDLDLTEKEDAFDYIEQLKTTGCDNIPVAVNEAIDKAKAKGVAVGVGDLIEDCISGKREAIRWPWSGLGGLTKALLPGTITLLCGNVGASKSFMQLQAAEYWHENGIKFALYELEEDKDYHLQRTLAQVSNNSGMTDPDYIQENPEISRSIYEEHREYLDCFGASVKAIPEAQITMSQMTNWIEGRAKADCRVIAIDPVTAIASEGKKVWDADNSFLNDVKRIAVDYKCSVVFVTHPIKAVSLPDVGQLAGGAAYSRFSQTIIWLESHNEKTSQVKSSCGTIDQDYNRTLHILKARNGKGQGARLAYSFAGDTLKLNELGIIAKGKNN